MLNFLHLGAKACQVKAQKPVLKQQMGLVNKWMMGHWWDYLNMPDTQHDRQGVHRRQKQAHKCSTCTFWLSNFTRHSVKLEQ